MPEFKPLVDDIQNLFKQIVAPQETEAANQRTVIERLCKQTQNLWKLLPSATGGEVENAYFYLNNVGYDGWDTPVENVCANLNKLFGWFNSQLKGDYFPFKPTLYAREEWQATYDSATFTVTIDGMKEYTDDGLPQAS